MEYRWQVITTVLAATTANNRYAGNRSGGDSQRLSQSYYRQIPRSASGRFPPLLGLLFRLLLRWCYLLRW